MAMAFSGDWTPTCTWMPKICRRRASHCISSTSRAYRGFGEMSCLAQSENGCVPEHIRARPRRSRCGVSSAIVASRSALASAALAQMPVMISIVDSSSSCFALG